jgi:hypothetical protein
MNGNNPCLLLSYLPRKSSMQHLVIIVRGFFQLIYFVKNVVKNLNLISNSPLLVLLVVYMKGTIMSRKRKKIHYQLYLLPILLHNMVTFNILLKLKMMMRRK